MKLSPERTSLSGRPEFLRPQPAPIVSAPAVRRVCCMCKLPDEVQMLEDGPLHSVTIELRWLQAENEHVAKQKVAGSSRRGWRYKFHLGRHAMERDICRSCLAAYNEMTQEFARKKSSELKASLHSDSYYLALCGD